MNGTDHEEDTEAVRRHLQRPTYVLFYSHALVRSQSGIIVNGRKLQTSLLLTDKQLILQRPYLHKFREVNGKFKNKITIDNTELMKYQPCQRTPKCGSHPAINLHKVE